MSLQFTFSHIQPLWWKIFSVSKIDEMGTSAASCTLPRCRRRILPLQEDPVAVAMSWKVFVVWLLAMIKLFCSASISSRTRLVPVAAFVTKALCPQGSVVKPLYRLRTCNVIYKNPIESPGKVASSCGVKRHHAFTRLFSSDSETSTHSKGSSSDIPASVVSGDNSEASSMEQLLESIQQKGDEIRQLKMEGSVSKEEIAVHVSQLLALKAKLPQDEGKTKPAPVAPKHPKKKSGAAPSNSKQKAPAVAEEMSVSELRLNRLSKVSSMKDAGVEPFAYSYAVTHSAATLSSLYEGKLEPGEEDADADVAVAGRIMTRRVFGKLAFFTLQDDSGIVQLQFDTNRLKDSFQVSYPETSTSHRYSLS
jgi:WHEP-TRS domain/OB-fold nucleic acid binding domain